MGWLQVCQTEFKEINHSKLFNITENANLVLHNQKLIPYGSYCLDHEKNWYTIYECMRSKENLFSEQE